jgi:DNA repair exonuclease SbcCD ATPase subunit
MGIPLYPSWYIFSSDYPCYPFGKRMPNKVLLPPAGKLPMPLDLIQRRIYLLRGQKVMLSPDLAELYKVETRMLVQAVRRNHDRFPEDFMFRLTEEESTALRSQIVILENGRGRYSKYAPLAFTEHGVAMLSSVLNSKRAVQMNIIIIRAFVKLRDLLATHKDLARKIEKLEANQKDHSALFSIVVDDIQKLGKKMAREIRNLKSPRRRKPHIGFVA